MSHRTRGYKLADFERVFERLERCKQSFEICLRASGIVQSIGNILDEGEAGDEVTHREAEGHHVKSSLGSHRNLERDRAAFEGTGPCKPGIETLICVTGERHSIIYGSRKSDLWSVSRGSACLPDVFHAARQKRYSATHMET
jgi:hypothetical protein